MPWCVSATTLRTLRSTGEQVENAGLLTRFAAVIANTWQIVFRSLKFQGFNLVISQIAVVFPYIIQAPRFFSQQITRRCQPNRHCVRTGSGSTFLLQARLR